MRESTPPPTDAASRDRWLVMVVKVPATPSRHRVAVWRDLRRCGAVPVGQGTWAAPDVPTCAAGVERARQRAKEGDGDVLVLNATGTAHVLGQLQAAFDSARADEWAEFLADCGKFQAEIEREINKQKFTLAELEEEEQSLERLRRWDQAIRGRDVFDSAAGAVAEEAIAQCAMNLDVYAELVYLAVHR